MAVTFVAAGTLIAELDASIDVVAPACAANDLLIATLVTREDQAISAPDGTWTQIIQNFYEGDSRVAIFWKLATGSGGTFTFTKAAGTQVFGGVILAYRGQNLTNPLDATTATAKEAGGADDNVNFNAFDPTGTNSHIVYTAVYLDDQTAFSADMVANTNPACTVRTDQETSVGSDFSIAVTSGDTTDGSAIASRTWASNSTTNTRNVGFVFGLAVASNVHDAHFSRGLRPRAFGPGLAR